MPVSKEFRDEFIQWSKSYGCHISPLLTITASKVGGIGIFLSLSESIKNGSLTKGGHLEVMRIPKQLTLSLDSFSTLLLDPQTAFDSQLPEEVGDFKQSELMIRFLSQFSVMFDEEVDPYVKGGVSETNILVGQIQMLVILKHVREFLLGADEEKYKILKDSPFAQLDKYLDLLELTDVPGLRVDEYYEKFLDIHKYYIRDYRLRIERVKFDAIYSALESITDIDCKTFVNDHFLRRVELSVISRLLEIPEKIVAPLEDTDPDETVGDDQEEQEPQYGFSVSSTLVPIIDFVNHSNDDLNAFFDVDPLTGDVLLRLFDDKIQKLIDSDKSLEEVELFIRYSDYEDALKFAFAYGFIPRSHEVSPLFELAIDRDYLQGHKVESEVENVKYVHDLGLLLKWLHVQPNVQFVLEFNSGGKLVGVKMNLDENFIVFGFVKGLKYHREAALAIVKYYSELQDDEYIEELLKLEESDENDVIGGYDVIPYSSVYVDGEVNLMEIVENIPDEEVDQLMLEFLSFFQVYAQRRLQELEDGLKKMRSTTTESTVRSFTQLESEVLSVFIQAYDSSSSDEAKLDLIIGSEEVDDEWLSQQLRPRTVPGERRAELYRKYADSDSLTEELGDLKV